MALSDEINSCSFNAEAGARTRGREQTFCDSVTIQGELTAEQTLTVSADAAFAANVGVTGLVTAGEISTLVLTLGPPIPPPPATSTFRRSARSSSKKSAPSAGDLSVAGTLHAGSELRVGSGYYASFKKSPAMTQVTDYVLPSSYPAVSGQVLSSSSSGEMEWVTGGGGGGSNPGFNQDYGFVYDSAPIGYDFGFI